MNRPLDPDQLAAQRAAEIERHGCRHLWLAVLLRGLEDARAAHRRLGSAAERTLASCAETDARAAAWLGSEDFRAVCHLAGFDAGWVLKKLAEAGIHQPEEETTPCQS